MDRVRLGRVLGKGTRLAAQTLYEAVDAATAAGPATQRGTAPNATANHGVKSRKEPPRGMAMAQRSVAKTTRNVRARSTRNGLLAPVKRASTAVSLEVTGSFFALFALIFALGAWHSRSAFAAGGDGMVRLALYSSVAAVFAYFALSNFRRARRLS